MGRKQTRIICKNVFKSGGNTPSKESFTQLWLSLIPLSEKNKHIKQPACPREKPHD